MHIGDLIQFSYICHEEPARTISEIYLVIGGTRMELPEYIEMKDMETYKLIGPDGYIYYCSAGHYDNFIIVSRGTGAELFSKSQICP